MTTTKRERVVAEWDGRGWLVMWEDGRVEGFPSDAAVTRAVRDRAKGVDIHVAEIEWRGDAVRERRAR